MKESWIPRVVLLALFILLGLGLGGEGLALAQDDVSAAKSHYSKGLRLYEVAEYQQALDEFKAAHLAKPDPAFLYNIAQCQRQLGNREAAVVFYKRYLTQSPKVNNRAEIEKRIADLELEIAAARNSTIAAESPVVPPSPTPVAPTVASPLPTPIATPTPTSSATNLVEIPATLESTPRKPTRVLPWVGVGVTSALGVGAVMMGLSAASKYNALKNSCGGVSPGCAESDINQVKSRATTANILWALTALAGTGTGLAFYWTPSETTLAVAWSY